MSNRVYHQFMFDKQLKTAVRLDMNNFSTMPVNVKTTQSDPVQYALHSIPIYLAERVIEILHNSLGVSPII